MELTESDARVFFKEGMSDAELDEHEDAIKNYDKALQIIEDAEIYLNKGISLAELEKYENALECYNKAIELDATDPLSWYNKGVVLTTLDKID